MSDEHRVPPPEKYTRILWRERPPSRGCAACGRPWTAHAHESQAEQTYAMFPCERCGAWLDTDCYRAYTVDARERARWEDPDDEMHGNIFLCSGCRS